MAIGKGYNKGPQKARTAMELELRELLPREMDLARAPATSQDLEGMLPRAALPPPGAYALKAPPEHDAAYAARIAELLKKGRLTF